MSSNTYTLKIDIDDSKIRELEKRLMAVMGGKTAGLSGVAGAAEGKGDKSALMNNIKKLGIIAIGVGSLVALVQKLTGMIVDSSPMLKGMLKLLNYSVMLILRPIGDLIGFTIRPLVIYFMRSVALPFYKQLRPIMQQLGTWLGMSWLSRNQKIDEEFGDNKSGWEAGFTHEEGLKNLEREMLYFASFLDIFTGDESQTKSTEDAIATLKAVFTAINGITIPTIDLSGIQTKINTTLTNITTLFTLDGIQTKINTTLTNITTLFNLTGIQTKIDTTIAGITNFDFESVFTSLATKIETIFNDLINGIYDLIPFLDRPDNNPSPTQQTIPPFAGSLDYIFGNNNDQNMNKPEEDPLTAGWNWAVTGLSESIKGWGV